MDGRIYDARWTAKVCGRLVARLSRDRTRAGESAWERKAVNLARAIRVIRDRMGRGPAPEASGAGWGETAARLRALLAARVCRGRPDTGPAAILRRRWQVIASRIANNMKVRKGFDRMKDTVRPRDILALLHRQQFRCAYTGDPLTPENAGADHMIPVSRGGPHSMGNIALVVQSVNTAKGSMTLAEFVSMCRKVASTFGPGEGERTEPPPVEILSGDADPCEILARLGYVDAAERVRKDAARLASFDRYRRQGKPVMDAAELTEAKAEEIAKLEREIQNLRVRRSVLRRETGWVKGADA